MNVAASIRHHNNPPIEERIEVDSNYERPPLYPKQKAAIFEERRFSLIEASTKAGKAQPLDSLLYTRRGPIRMGDVEIGDRLLTPDGSAKVKAIYPQGEREVLRITFSDGAIVETDADHLWEVHQFQSKPQIVTTEQLQTWPNRRLRRAWVPKIKPAQFEHRAVPVNPYLIGVLIGDGGLTGESVMLSNADADLLEEVRSLLPPGHELVHSSNHDWRISAGAGAAALRNAGDHLRGQIERIGLGGKGSHEKFVPDLYRYNSTKVRQAVLQGILDTDGFVDKHGQPGIEQTSERLARDIEEMVRSLGGTVLTRLRRVNGYRAKDGRFVLGRPVWRQVIRVQNGADFFRLERKRAKCVIKRKTGHRFFRSIEFARRAPTQCVELDDERQLYLTDGFIPTHNTSGCIAWIVEQAIKGQDGYNYWWVAPVSDQALIAFRRMMRSLPPDMFTANLSLKTITLANGAVIWFKSGDKPNSLYGEDVYAAVLDEASRMKEDAYIAVRTTLTYTRGMVRIIGNVRGRKNWFYRMARKAERDEMLGVPNREMGYHKIVAADAVAAGVLDQKEIDDAREQLPEQWFKELYFAEASDDGGNPFGLQHIEAIVKPDLGGGVVSNKMPRAWGWDLAKKRDYFVGIALDEDGAVCRFVRHHGMPWGEVKNTIIANTGRTPALADSTGVGDPIVEDVQRMMGQQPGGEGSFQGYIFTSGSKQRLMEGLAAGIQGKTVWIADNVVRQELEQFEFEVTRTGVRYSAPEGYFDDCVCALSLAKMALTVVPRGVEVSPAALAQIAALAGGRRRH